MNTKYVDMLQWFLGKSVVPLGQPGINLLLSFTVGFPSSNNFAEVIWNKIFFDVTFAVPKYISKREEALTNKREKKHT